ncbi:MAG: YccF domain-containing protein [Clostridia bacterium]|nr:YccF domain-containing protein [Clostridia bacterium]
MKTLGNIIWFLFVGLASFISWGLIGIVLCITIIGIPFGKQCFKIASVAVFPFGKIIDSNFGDHPVGNIIWALLAGWELALSYALSGVIFCVTIIGIPFGLQCFKLAKLSFAPFGALIFDE